MTWVVHGSYLCLVLSSIFDSVFSPGHRTLTIAYLVRTRCVLGAYSTDCQWRSWPLTNTIKHNKSWICPMQASHGVTQRGIKSHQGVIKGHQRSSRRRRAVIQVSKSGMKNSCWLKLAREPFIFDDFYVILKLSSSRICLWGSGSLKTAKKVLFKPRDFQKVKCSRELFNFAGFKSIWKLSMRRIQISWSRGLRRPKMMSLRGFHFLEKS